MATAATARANRIRRQRLLLGLALLLLVGGGAYYYLAKPQPPKAAPQPNGTIAVPVAARAINKGTEMTGAGLIRPMFLKPEQVPPGALLRTGMIQGRVTREGMRPGDYFSESNLAPTGAPAGFSGLVSPGRRIVVIDSTNIVGTRGFVREGDVVDLLAITGGPGAVPPRRAAGTSMEGGGVQPGAAGAIRQPPANPAAGDLSATSATLVAEGARVVIPPAARPVRGQPHFTVLEMKPEEAHVATLVIATGQQMRMVYRPFNDSSVVLRHEPLEANTRAPRDPLMVEMIDGVTRSVVRATLD